MKILVTGGLGFVGINIVRDLLQSLPEATIIAADVLRPDDLIQRFLAPVSDHVQYAVLDVTERPFVDHLIRSASITHIVHAAAITPNAERERHNPTQIVDVNLIGAINVLDAAFHAPQVERAVLLSSSGLYGAPLDDPTTPQAEDGPLQLDNLYSITKDSAELLAMRYAELCGKPFVSARLAAPYGPMERPTGSRQAMGQPQRLLAALRSNEPITVAGPSILRDWTYIADTAAAIRALLVAPQLSESVYNVSCGVAVRFGQVVEAFAAHGLLATWIDQAYDADVAMRLNQTRAPLDIRRLQRDTGFVPQYDLRAGVAAYVGDAVEGRAP